MNGWLLLLLEAPADTAGTPEVEAEGSYQWGHLVMYDRQFVRPLDVKPVLATPGLDREGQ